jgi:hypothetical protein
MSNNNNIQFQFVIEDLPEAVSPDQSRRFSLNCSTIFTPGLSIGVNRHETYDGSISTPRETAFDDINLIFPIGKDLANWKFIFNWMQFIDDNKYKFTVAGEEPVATGIFTSNMLDIEFLKLWPTNLGQITVSIRNDSSQDDIESQVTFTFADMKFK